MAYFTGQDARLYAANGTTNLASVLLVEIGTSDTFVIDAVATRILRACTYDAVVGNFSVVDALSAATTVTAVELATLQLSLTVAGKTPPCYVTSSSSKVATLANVGGVQGIRLNIESVQVDVTEHGDTSRKFTDVILGWSVDVDRLWIDENFTVDVQATMQQMQGNRFGVEVFTDVAVANAHRHVGFVTIEGVEVLSPGVDIQREGITLRGWGDLYSRDVDT